MKYMGSKARIAKHILPIILKDRQPGQWYVEPFMGGCNTLDKVDNPRIGADTHSELVAMYKALQDGWMPPDLVTEDDYNGLKKSGGDHLRGYVGFSMSFGGKWWGGYRRDKPGQHGDMENMVTQSRRSKAAAMKQIAALDGCRFVHSGYLDLDIPPNSIIYCDPPYKGTTAYRGGFDHDTFWSWCETQVAWGHKVFVSEYQAPEGWECVWHSSLSNTLSRTGVSAAKERLFTKTITTTP